MRTELDEKDERYDETRNGNKRNKKEKHKKLCELNAEMKSDEHSRNTRAFFKEYKPDQRTE